MIKLSRNYHTSHKAKEIKEKRTAPNLRIMMNRSRTFIFQEILIFTKTTILEKYQPFFEMQPILLE